MGSPACHRRVGCEGAARHGLALRRAQRRRRRKGLLCFALLCTLVQYCLQFAPSEAVTTFAHCTARCGRASLKASARAPARFLSVLSRLAHAAWLETTRRGLHDTLCTAAVEVQDQGVAGGRDFLRVRQGRSRTVHNALHCSCTHSLTRAVQPRCLYGTRLVQHRPVPRKRVPHPHRRTILHSCLRRDLQHSLCCRSCRQTIVCARHGTAGRDRGAQLR